MTHRGPFQPLLFYDSNFRTTLESMREMHERLLTCLVLHKPGLQRGFPFLQSSVLCVSVREDTEHAALKFHSASL